MKAKLLRKVRKEFSINNHPNGLRKDQLFVYVNTFVQTLTLKIGDNITDYCVVVPTKDSQEYRLTGVYHFETEKEAFYYLHSIMLYRALLMYDKHGTRRIAKREIAKKLYLK